MNTPKVTSSDCVAEILQQPWAIGTNASDWKRRRKLMAPNADGLQVRVFENTVTKQWATVVCELEYAYDKQPIPATWTDISAPGSSFRMLAEGPSYKPVNERYEAHLQAHEGNFYPVPDAAIVSALLAAAKPLPKDSDYGVNLYWSQLTKTIMITASDGYGGEYGSKGARIVDSVEHALHAAGAHEIEWEAEFTPTPCEGREDMWGFEHIGEVGTTYYPEDDEAAHEAFWFGDSEQEDEEDDEEYEDPYSKDSDSYSMRFESSELQGPPSHPDPAVIEAPDDWDAIQKLRKKL